MDDLADELEDIIRDFCDGNPGSGSAAAEIVERLPELLYQAGWMPPERAEKLLTGISHWSGRAARDLPGSPSFNANPGPVLISWLTELAGIVNGRA